MDAQEHIDYDIHGLLGIRLINPSANDAAAVASQLGPLRKPLLREPDIVVRFVECLPTPRMRPLGPNKHGFTDDGFFVLRNNKEEVKVRVPFDQIGTPCEIVCESGLQSVALLVTLLNLTLLKKDCVSLHASAFVYNNTGVLVTGWARGGKTEALLTFALHGAEYVGDEWVLLSGDGQKMYGIPESIEVSDWHLEYLPHVRRQVKTGELLLFKGIHCLERIQKMVPNGKLGNVLPLRLLRKAMPGLRSLLNLRLEPQAIFGNGFNAHVAKPEKVFLLMSHQDPVFEIQPTDPVAIAKRMVPCIQYEQLAFVEHYLASKFAFPEMRSDFIERAHELQYDILCRALAGKEAYIVRHPYPFSFHELYEAMKPFCSAQRANPGAGPEGMKRR